MQPNNNNQPQASQWPVLYLLSLLLALPIPPLGIGLAFFVYLHIKQNNLRGKWIALSVMILCILFTVGMLLAFAFALLAL